MESNDETVDTETNDDSSSSGQISKNISSQSSSSTQNNGKISSAKAARANSASKNSGSQGGKGVKKIRYRVRTRTVQRTGLVGNGGVVVRKQQQIIKPASAPATIVVARQKQVKSG